MSFYGPAWLGLGVLLPLIVLLYFKKKQVLELRVSSLEFWEEAVREKQGFRVKSIDRYLPLALQLMAGLLLVLAAAGPLWVRQPAGDRVIVALDCSLSMRAVEGSASRFTAAKEEAGRIIRDLPGKSAVDIVLLADGVRELVTGASPQRALEALKGVECTSRPLDVAMAAGYLGTSHGSVIMVTDKDIKLGDRVVRLGGQLDNAGITAAYYDYYSGSAFFTVRNYSRDNKRLTVSLWSAGKKIDVRSVDIEAGAQGQFSFPGPKAGDGLALKIEERDMLEEDNRYLLPAGEKGKKKVLLYGSNYFLEKALASMADVSLARAGTPAGEEDCRAVIVAGGGDAPGIPAGAGVWHLVPGSGTAGESGVKNAPLRAAGSLLTGGMELREVYLGEPAPLASREGLQDVLKAGDATVMAAGLENGRKTVYSTIDLTRTNLVLLPDFPLLASNIVNWLSDGGYGDYPGNPPACLVTGGSSPGIAANKAREALPLVVPLGKAAVMALLALLVVEWEVYRRGL